MSLYSTYNQFFPPKPTFTEKEVPSQAGRVFIVTGGNSGVGYELCKILYGKGATVYMTTRSKASPLAISMAQCQGLRQLINCVAC